MNKDHALHNSKSIFIRDQLINSYLGWDQEASKEKLLEVFGAFGPHVKEMLDLVDSSTLKVWSLLDMERIPRWYRGRLALLGDAAHPFMPCRSTTLRCGVSSSSYSLLILRCL